MTAYWKGQDTVVTVLHYKIVVEEIVVPAKRLEDFNRQALNDVIDPSDFLTTKNNKFQKWESLSVSQVANARHLVNEFGEGYVAFKGDVTSGSDDLFPCHSDAWSNSPFDPIPFANNDYFESFSGECCKDAQLEA